MPEINLVERGCAELQGDGDPGYAPVVYVDRRGNSLSVPREHDESDAEFSHLTGLHVCCECLKYCEPALTEHRNGDLADSYFCYKCHCDGGVRVLVEDGIVDLHTAHRVVHRLASFEFPGPGIERVTVTR